MYILQKIIIYRILILSKCFLFLDNLYKNKENIETPKEANIFEIGRIFIKFKTPEENPPIAVKIRTLFKIIFCKLKNICLLKELFLYRWAIDGQINYNLLTLEELNYLVQKIKTYKC